jgi:hypothetical protein
VRFRAVLGLARVGGSGYAGPAAQTLDLTRVLDVLCNYHRIAWLTQRQGPEAHRRMLDHVEHGLRTGEAAPGSVSAAEVKALLQERRNDRGLHHV